MSDVDVNDEEFRQFIEAGAQAVSRAVELAAVDVWGNIGREAPVDHGRLAGSFTISGSGVEYSISTNVEYALFVHEGTMPYEIVPTSASVLRFDTADGVMFATRVDHPGIEANPYADRAIENAETRIDDFMNTALAEAGVA